MASLFLFKSYCHLQGHILLKINTKKLFFIDIKFCGCPVVYPVDAAKIMSLSKEYKLDH